MDKTCTKCKETKPEDHYYKSNKYHCKSCIDSGCVSRYKNRSDRQRFRDKQVRKLWLKAHPHIDPYKSAKRRAVKKQATPAWVTPEYVMLFYKQAQMESKRIGEKVHVDHIVPLTHPLVCGLHCEDNLQLLTATDNLKKSNTYIV